MALRAFGYYGGKRHKLKFILPQLQTEHRTFVELFAGSAAVLLNKPPVGQEILNDLAGEVHAFWTALRYQPDKLIRAVMLTPPGEAAFKAALDAPPTDDDTEIARRFYTRVTQSFNNIPLKEGATHTINGSQDYISVRKQLHAVADRIREVHIENNTAVKVIKRVCAASWDGRKKSPILFYCDPPYTAASRRSHGQYLHDDFDHEEFLRAITTAPPYCKFAVSGYDDPLYNDALGSWQKTSIDVYRGAHTLGGKRTEIIWRNYQIAPDFLRTEQAADPIKQMLNAGWRPK